MARKLLCEGAHPSASHRFAPSCSTFMETSWVSSSLLSSLLQPGTFFPSQPCPEDINATGTEPRTGPALAPGMAWRDLLEESLCSLPSVLLRRLKQERHRLRRLRGQPEL